jgi:hypothetical protein
LSTTRITVLDVFYYLHRGYDFDAIHAIMPSLSREEFEVVLQYVNAHHEQLVEKDRQAEEFIGRGLAEQGEKGLCPEIDEATPRAERIARLKRKAQDRIGVKNGEGHPG